MHLLKRKKHKLRRGREYFIFPGDPSLILHLMLDIKKQMHGEHLGIAAEAPQVVREKKKNVVQI